VYKPLVVNVQGRKQQGRRKHSYRWQDNIKTDFLESVECILEIKDMVQWQILIKIVMNFRVL
jgi:hypothetical protein